MLTLRQTTPDESPPAGATFDTTGMTEQQVEQRRALELQKAHELRKVQVFRDGVHLGSMRDVIANYPGLRAELRALVDASRAQTGEVS